MIRKDRLVSPAEMERHAECTNQIFAINQQYLTENGFPRKAFMLTLGCQQNEADSEKLCGMAEAMGYEITDAPDGASLIMVNTCAIREHAEKRALCFGFFLRPFMILKRKKVL